MIEWFGFGFIVGWWVSVGVYILIHKLVDIKYK